MTFVLRKATLVVDSAEDVSAGPRFNMPAELNDDVINGRVRITGQALVVSANKPLDKVKELIACGMRLAALHGVKASRSAAVPVSGSDERQERQGQAVAPIAGSSGLDAMVDRRFRV
jgi:hypothetical protein